MLLEFRQITRQKGGIGNQDQHRHHERAVEMGRMLTKKKKFYIKKDSRSKVRSKTL